MRARFIIIGGLITSFIGLAGHLRAEGEAAEAKTVEQKLEEFDQKVKVPERLRELEAEKAKEKAKEAPTFGVGKDGGFLDPLTAAFR